MAGLYGIFYVNCYLQHYNLLFEETEKLIGLTYAINPNIYKF